MDTEWQTPPGADIILRAFGGKELHAHKLILSLASPVFRDMLSVPQPPSTDSSELAIVDVDDPPEALEIFLQTIYPGPSPIPPFDDIVILASVLRLADKYDAKHVLGVHGGCPLSTYGELSPIEIYAVLCTCGCEEEAGTVARCVPLASLEALDSNPLLPLITVTQYHRLVSFLAARDRRMRDIVGLYQQEVRKMTRRDCDENAHQMYSSVVANSIQAAFEKDPCVLVSEGLDIVAGAPITFHPCNNSCEYTMKGLRRHARGLLTDLVEMAETLPWKN